MKDSRRWPAGAVFAWCDCSASGTVSTQFTSSSRCGARRGQEEILCGGGQLLPLDGRRGEGARLYMMRPERQWVFGIPCGSPQRGARSGGGWVWLY